MKVKLFSSSGIFQNNVILDGFTMNDFLTLYRTPDAANEAATKRYVDSFSTVYDVSQITGDTIPKDVLVGSFGGDLMGFNRTDVYLTPTGVQPGTYNQVTVNEKGRVTAATTQSAGSSVLHFANITNKPVSVNGYVGTPGDYAVKTAGADSEITLTGNLSSSVSPSDALHVATRSYLTTKVAAMSATLSVGSMKITTVSNAGAKYLRANGGVLDKASYAALYSIIGDTYSNNSGTGGYMGQPWRQQYAFNSSQSAALTWTADTSLPTAVSNSQAIVTKNRVYLLGGNSSAAVYTAPINPDGTLGTWTTSTPLPSIAAQSQAIITKNRVYLLGGYDTAAVYTAPINADGTLGAWTTSTPLPVTVHQSQAVVTKNRVYLLSGVMNDSYSSHPTYTAPINPDGTLGSWTAGTPHPTTGGRSHAIVTKDRVYMLGGDVNHNGSNAVRTAPINADGTLGTWIQATSLPTAVYGSQAVVTRDRVYLLGGGSIEWGSQSNAVYTAPINTDGTLGAWTTGTSLPAAVSHSQAIVTKGRVYLLGGYVNDSLSAAVYTASFTGGSNDYLALIDNNTVNSTTQFKLPDYSSESNGVMEYFIRAIP